MSTQILAMQAPGGLGLLGGALPFIFLFAVLYFVMILPQQRRQMHHAKPRRQPLQPREHGIGLYLTARTAHAASTSRSGVLAGARFSRSSGALVR